MGDGTRVPCLLLSCLELIPLRPHQFILSLETLDSFSQVHVYITFTLEDGQSPVVYVFGPQSVGCYVLIFNNKTNHTCKIHPSAHYLMEMQEEL